MSINNKKHLFESKDYIVTNFFKKKNDYYNIHLQFKNRILYDTLIFKFNVINGSTNLVTQISVRWKQLKIKNIMKLSYTVMINVETVIDNNIFSQDLIKDGLKITILDIKHSGKIILSEKKYNHINDLLPEEIDMIIGFNREEQMDEFIYLLKYLNGDKDVINEVYGIRNKNVGETQKALDTNADYFLGLIDNEEKETK